MQYRIKQLKFRIASTRVRFTFMRKVRLYTKIILFCIKTLLRIGIPISDKQYDTMAYVLSVYDQTIADLNASVDIFRKRVNIYKEEVLGSED